MSLPKVILKKGKEKSIQRRHPWVFSGAVFGVSREINDGEMVEVVNSKNIHLANGFFSDKGSIDVRILTFGTETFDDTFWQKKLYRKLCIHDNRLNNTKAPKLLIAYGASFFAKQEGGFNFQP